MHYSKIISLLFVFMLLISCSSPPKGECIVLGGGDEKNLFKDGFICKS